MAKHTHKFVAIPITGLNVGPKKEREDLFGFRLECEHCGKQAKVGDTIIELRRSWWGEVVPETRTINHVLKES